MILALLGGVSFAEIARVFAVVIASAVAAGSLGSTLALWREKTFQSMATTLLALVLWLGAGEVVARSLGGTFSGASADTWASAVSPWRATLAATRTSAQSADSADTVLGLHEPSDLFVLLAGGLAVLLNATAVALVRVWNPPREARPAQTEREEQAPHLAGGEHHWSLAQHGTDPAAAARQTAATVSPPRGRTRRVWDNPILWREVRTWAYGRKMLIVRLAYLALFAASAVGLHWTLGGPRSPGLAELSLPLVPLFVLSLALINVQAVTSLTSERDVRALDLLLVTDLTPREFIFGKLAGALYNTKEMVLLPLALCVYLMIEHAVSAENLVYLAGGWLVMVGFVAMLGVHCGMSYANSRAAIAVSIGTVFFLFVGVATCMRIMVAFSGSFQFQLQPFLAFVVGGGVGLLVALGWRNASTAIWIAAFACPFFTFYAITSFLLNYTLAVFLVVVATYGFTTAAMLVPALHEFDVATGRTTGEEG